MIDVTDDFERLAPVTLSIVCFRYVPWGWPRDDARLDGLNTAIMQEVQAGGEAFLTNAVLRGRFSLRTCILHYATTEADLESLLDVIRGTGVRLAASMTVG